MNLYGYIANNNPSMAKALCHKYGYKISGVQSKDDLGVCLEQLVAKEGEPALKDIVQNHPDRDLIIELNEKETKQLGHDGKHYSTCQCNDCKKPYMNYTGEEKIATTSNMVSQTNTFLLASAFLLGIAIISKKL